MSGKRTSRKLARPYRRRKKMLPTEYNKNLEYIKGIETDESIPQDMQNVTEIDGGILEYVRERMHCERVTQEVRRQAAAFEQEMNRM